MIVRDFLLWVSKAPAGERAEATSALARAYLHSDLSSDDLAATEGVMLMLLDDRSPLVRRALAEALAASPIAPPAVIMALAADQPQIAALVYASSPLFIDADLVDAVAVGDTVIQAAIAGRVALPRAAAAAIAEMGTEESCQILAGNCAADIAPLSLDRIVERFGHLPAIRETLLIRGDIPAATRQMLATKLSETLAGFVVDCEWLKADRARRIARDACEKATITIAADTPQSELRPLVRYLCASGQLTAGLILRALLSGNTGLFEEALVELTGMPVTRISGIVHGRGEGSLHALFEKAQLPPSTYPAFKEAILAMRDGFVYDSGGAARLKRRMIERVLTRCEDADPGEVATLLTLLRRFATEAAREEARMYFEELVNAADDTNGRSAAA